MRRLLVTNGHRPLAGLCVAVGIALVVVSPALAGSEHIHTAGSLRVYDGGDDVHAELDVTYDTRGRTQLEFRVTGLAAATAYVVRAHTGACARTPGELGPVFQASPNPDPDAVSSPEYVNRSNEIWLDVETGPTGDGSSHTDQPWQPSPIWRPASIVVHERLSQSHPLAPRVGQAVACLDVRF